MVYTNLTAPRRPARCRNGVPQLPEQSEAINQTAKIPSPGVTAYSIREDSDVTEEGMLLGAGVLPFTISPNGTLFFLLGREQYVQGWRGSETWSAFEGGTKPYDANVYDTAAREYIEESLGILHETCTRDTISDIRRDIENGDYALRVTLCIKNSESDVSSKNHMRFHSTFVRLFEWDDGIIERFKIARDALTQLSSDLKNAAKADKTQIVPESFRGHAAVIDKRVPGNTTMLDVASDFLEKSEVQLWSAHHLKEVVLNIHKGPEVFRPCFVRTVGVVLQEFKRRLQYVPEVPSFQQSPVLQGEDDINTEHPVEVEASSLCTANVIPKRITSQSKAK